MGYVSQLWMSSVEWNAAFLFPEEKPALVPLPALHFLGRDSTSVTRESHLPHHLLQVRFLQGHFLLIKVKNSRHSKSFVVHEAWGCVGQV